MLSEGRLAKRSEQEGRRDVSHVVLLGIVVSMVRKTLEGDAKETTAT